MKRETPHARAALFHIVAALLLGLSFCLLPPLSPAYAVRPAPLDQNGRGLRTLSGPVPGMADHGERAHAYDRTGAPPSLQPWIPWVLYGQEDKTCTLASDDASKRFCSWPSRLRLELTDTGIGFSQEWLIETRSLVALPGGRNQWPEAVRDGHAAGIVLDHDGTPSMWLLPGHHVITGMLSWQEPPDSITLPAATGIFTLINRSHGTGTPFIDRDGKLWLKSRQGRPSPELDHVSLQVFRKLRDAVPLQEDLHLLLTVSGSPREVLL